MKKLIVNLFIIVCSQLNPNNALPYDLVTMKEKIILLDSMNSYRVKLGLKKVKYSVEVEALAKTRTKTIYNHLITLTKEEYIKNYKVHTHAGFWLDAITYNARLQVGRSKYTIGGPSENVCYFMGYTDNLIPKSFEGWKNSEDHWSEMMSESVDYISLHYEKSNIGILAVMILFKKYKK